MRDIQVDGLELVSEMMQTDNFVMENVAVELEGADILAMLKDIDELDEYIMYTEAMVPVIQVGADYLIEYNNIVKVMLKYQHEGKVLNEEQVVELICAENSINMDANQVYVVMESDETYRRTVFSLQEKIKKTKDPKQKNSLRIRLAKMKERFSRLKASSKLKALKSKSTTSPGEAKTGAAADSEE